jgi:hypothetical protein
MENSNNGLVYLGQDNSEFVINKATGVTKISGRACSRLLERSPSTVSELLKTLEIVTENTKIQTSGGLQGVRLISAKDFYKLAERLKPELAEAMLEMGANSYLLYAAGYKVSVVQPESKPITKVALAEAYLKQAKLEAATADLPGLTNINNALINSQDQPGLPGYFNVWETLSETYDYRTTKLLNKPISKRMGQAARLHGNKPKADTVRILVTQPNGALKSIKTNIYPVSLIPVFDEILRQAVTEFKIEGSVD